MAYVRFLGGKVGQSYHGTDDGKSVNIKLGHIAEVSDTMANRLMKDFEEQFERVPETKAVEELEKIRSKDLDNQKKAQKKSEPEKATEKTEAEPAKVAVKK